MTKTEATQFITKFASYKSQRAAEEGMKIPRRTLVRRFREASKLLGKKAVDEIMARSAVAVPKAAMDAQGQKAFVRQNPRTTEKEKITAGLIIPKDEGTDAVCAALVSGNDKDLQLKMVQDENKRLRDQNKTLADQALTDVAVRRHIFGLANHEPQLPDWLRGLQDKTGAAPGVPILFGSDWHWGEVVNPDEIGGVNSYDMEISHARLNLLVETAINLLTNHMVNPSYPGIVFALGGDMVSGNIHEELSETNDLPIMPVVLDLIDHLVLAIKRLKEVFGRVFLPCVAGNHGRSTKKIRAKQFNHNSYDWLIYQSLDRHFKDDEDVRFFIPEGTDALVTIAGHKYLFTHGNQFRGGDGMIGPLGPIIRGDHKKRSRNGQVDQEYDTLVIGHFHQLIQMKRVIVNGSLIGYNEYAYANNFGYEPPQQALWISHPQHGITFSMPVNVGEDHGKKGRNGTNSQWVAWHDPQKKVA